MFRWDYVLGVMETKPQNLKASDIKRTNSCFSSFTKEVSHFFLLQKFMQTRLLGRIVSIFYFNCGHVHCKTKTKKCRGFLEIKKKRILLEAHF